MTNSSMKAAITLTLEDRLSKGLATIQKGFEDLRVKGNQLSLGKLEKSADMLRIVGREVKNLISDMGGIAATADRGWAAIRRMASVKFQPIKNWGAKTFGPSSKLGAFAGAAAGYSIAKPVQDYATFENTLRHIAITEKKSGPAVEVEIARLTKNLKAEALASGQSSEALAHAYNFLITTGMSSKQVDELMPSHAKAATAYNISSESMGQAVFALNDSFKIPAQDMGAALSAMAYAAKEAHFTVENFSQYLPAIGGRMQLLGMTGRGAADTAFAALETVVKNSSQPGQAATNFQDMLNYMTSPLATRSFARQGINLPGSLIAAEKRGINPMDAFRSIVEGQIKGKSPVEAAAIVGKLVHNQEAASAVLSILQHKVEYLDMKAKFAKVDASTLDTDFKTASRAPEVTIRKGEEAASQVERRAGQGFTPIMNRVVDGLKAIATGMDTLDMKFPGLTDVVLTVTGSFLALAAALGTIGVVAPAVSAGAALTGGVAAGVARFGFKALRVVWAVIAAAADAVVTGLTAAATSAAATIAASLLEFVTIFGSALLGIPALAALAKAGSDAETPQNRAMMEKLAKERRSTAGGLGDLPNDGYGADGMPLPVPGAASTSHKIEVTVHAEPGTGATVTRSTPGVNVVAPDPGQTAGRH